MTQSAELDWFVAKLRASVNEKKTAGAGMTEIAFRCGISNQMLHAYLRGMGQPKIGTYVNMARYFGWDHPLAGEGDAATGHSRWRTQTAPDLGEHALMAGVL